MSTETARSLRRHVRIAVLLGLLAWSVAACDDGGGATVPDDVLSQDGVDTAMDVPDTSEVVDPCTGVSACVAEGATCSGDQLVTCQRDVDGCLVEVRLDCAATEGGSCDDSAAPAACTVDPCADVGDSCAEPGQRCNGSVLESCQPDGEAGCLVLTTTECDDGAGGRCDDTVDMCTHDPCFGVSNCTVAGTTCRGDLVETCQPDANGCLVLATPLDCAAYGASCSAVAGTTACVGAECVDVFVGSALGRPAFLADNTGAGDDFVGSCDGSMAGGGEDVVFGWLAPDAGCYVFDTVGSSGNTDTVVYVLDDCTTAGELECNDDIGVSATQRVSRVRLDTVAESAYLVVVDGRPGSVGSFDVNIERVADTCTESLCADGVDDDNDGLVDCADPDCDGIGGCVETLCTDGLDDEGDGLVDCDDPDCASYGLCVFDCADAELGAATGTPVVAHGHHAVGDDFAGSCAATPHGADLAWAWRAPQSGCFRFDAHGASHSDPVVYVLDACLGGTELTCDDDSGPSSATSARATADLVGGTPYIVVVDASSVSGSGAFALDIERIGAACSEQQCDDGSDDDGDGAVDCADDDCHGDVACIESSCTDGLDDDGDGRIDCEDSDCFAAVDCATACPTADLGSAVGAGVMAGEIAGTGDDATISCGGDGSDVALRWAAPSTACYVFETSSPDFDTRLAVLDGCATGREVACDDNGGVASGSRLVLPVEAGTERILWIDSPAGASGRWTLDIEPSSAACAELVCDDALDDDGDGLVDCDDPDCFSATGLCAAESDCTNAQDDDGDGLIDCLDPDCGPHHFACDGVCGNGVVDAGESCDDGNLDDGDGCSSACTLSGETCTTPARITGSSYRLRGDDWGMVANNIGFNGPGCNVSSSGGGELIFEVPLLAGQAVRARQLAPDFTTIFTLLEGVCEFSAACTINESNLDEVAFAADADTTVYLVVEHRFGGEQEPFDLQIDVYSPVCGDGIQDPGEACDDGNLDETDGCTTSCTLSPSSCAAPIVVDSPSFRLSASSSALSDDLLLEETTCVQRVSRGELVFEVAMEAGQVAVLRELGATFVANLSVMVDSCGPMVPCVDSLLTEDSLSYTAPIDQTVYFVVESYYSGDRGDFDIEIEVITPTCGNGVLEPGEVCDDGNSDDTDTCTSACLLGGASCATPIVMSGATMRFQGSGAALTDDLSLGSQCLPSGSSSGELVVEVALSAGESLRVRQLSEDFDSYLSILAAGCTDGASCAANVTHSIADRGGVLYTASTAETVHAVVEARTASETGVFDVVLDVTSPVCGDGQLQPGEPCDDGNLDDSDGCTSMCVLTGELCSTATRVSGGYQLVGRPEALRDDLELDSSSCEQPRPGRGGGELVFEVALEAGQHLWARQRGFLDVSLSVLGTTCGPTPTCRVSESAASGLFYTALVDETVFLVMEASGELLYTDEAFDLRIDLVEPEVCDDALDNDADGLVDCDDEDCFGAPGVCDAVELNCADRLDNDGDGFDDCADLDCFAHTVCGTAAGMHESFDGDFDLSGRRLVFTPDGAGSYVASTVASPGFTTSPGSGKVTRRVAVYPWNFEPYALTVVGGVPFFGERWTTIFPGSNGAMTFGTYNTGVVTSLGAFYAGVPKLIALAHEFDLSVDGSVIVDEFSDRVVVTYDRVRSANALTRSSFQVTLYGVAALVPGLITIDYGVVEAATSWVGLSNSGTGWIAVASDFY